MAHGLGTYSVNSRPEQGDLPYSITISQDGTLLTKGYGGDGIIYSSTGNWIFSGNDIFTGTIISIFPDKTAVGISQQITFTYSDTGILTEGIWDDTNNPYCSPLSGKFSTFQKVIEDMEPCDEQAEQVVSIL